MIRLRPNISSAAQGVLLAVCLSAVVAATAWVLYVNGWIGADWWFALRRFSVGGAVGAVVLGLPLSVAALRLRDRRLARRRT